MYDDRHITYFQLIIAARKTESENEEYKQVDTGRETSATVEDCMRILFLD